MPNATRNAILTVVFFLAAHAAAEPAFLPRRDFGSDIVRLPNAIAIDDFNHDSIPDLAVVNIGSGGVSVMIGNGDGTFSFHGAIAEYDIRNGAVGVATGDFNGDGHVDLAVTAQFGDSVQLLLGTGLGDFRPGPVVPAGLHPGPIAAGDFNGDTIPDLLVVNAVFFGSISVLLGNGDGTFQAPLTFPTGELPGSLVVADFNGDGIADVAVPALSDRGRHEIDVLLGRGDGTFGPVQIVDSGNNFGVLASADFNGDAIPDLVMTLPTGFQILFGNGDGTFGAPLTRSLSSLTSQLAAADLDGDGKVDLVVSNSIVFGATAERPITITVLGGNGDGTFGEERMFQTGNQPSVIAIQDLNGDNQPDLVVADTGSFTVSVLVNNSNQQR